MAKKQEKIIMNFTNEQLSKKMKEFKVITEAINEKRIDEYEINELVTPTILKNIKKISNKDAAIKLMLISINEMLTIFLKSGKYSNKAISLTAPIGVVDSRMHIESNESHNKEIIWNMLLETMSSLLQKGSVIKLLDGLYLYWSKSTRDITYVMNPNEIIKLQERYFV